MPSEIVYDVAAETAKLLPDKMSVGDKEFRVRRTGTALKNVMKLDPGEDFDESDTDESVRILYQGLSYLLVDPQRDPEVSEPDEKDVWHPSAEWLADEVDFEVAMALMDKLVPRAKEGRKDPDPTDAVASPTPG